MSIDPVSLTVASTLISAGSSVAGGVAAFQTGRYQAAVAEANKRSNLRNAAQAVEVGERDVRDIGREFAGQIGEFEAAAGASGLALDSPSIIQTRNRARVTAVEEGRRRMDAAFKQAANFKTQANVQDTVADASRTAGNLSLFEGLLRAGGSLVGGASPTRSSFGTLKPTAPLPRPRPRYYAQS